MGVVSKGWHQHRSVIRDGHLIIPGHWGSFLKIEDEESGCQYELPVDNYVVDFIQDIEERKRLAKTKETK